MGLKFPAAFCVLIFLILSACSGKGSSPSVDGLPVEVADKAELETYECNDGLIGEIIYVSDLEQNFECDGEEWLASKDKMEPGSSSAKSSSSDLNPDENSLSSEGDELAEQSSSSSEVYFEMSSSEVSSSSVTMAIPCKTETEDNCEYGSLYDPRDGRTYKTVKIGDQWWMAENIRLDTNYTDADSCYSKGALYDCAKYGKLYEWSVTNTQSKNYVNATRVCPAGWILPTSNDWKILLAAIGGEENAGKLLKSTSGWSDDGNGTDAFGFTALPGGYYDISWYAKSPSDLVGSIEIFWSYDFEMKRDSYSRYYYPYRLALKSESDEASLYFGDLAPNNSYHVRCVCEECQSGQYSNLAVRAAPCKSESEDNCEYDILVDARDGRTYKIVKIGEQWWMAENLNFVTEQSRCYDQSDSSCVKLGRLYLRGEAMDSAGVYSLSSKGCGIAYENVGCSPIYPVHGICPAGWHLPDKTEWNILISAVGGSSVAGLMLKSASGWNSGENGADAYAFSVLPSGANDDGSGFATFWTSVDGQSIRDLMFLDGSNFAYINIRGWNNGRGYIDWNPIRCVKD